MLMTEVEWKLAFNTKEQPLSKCVHTFIQSLLRDSRERLNLIERQ